MESIFPIAILILFIAALFLVGWILKQKFENRLQQHSFEQKRIIDTLQTELRYEMEKSKVLEEGVTSLNEELRKERENVLASSSKYATILSSYKELEKSFEIYKAEKNDLKDQMYKEFRLLADNILDEKTQKFTKQNKQQLEGILHPLGDKIRDFEKKVEVANKESISQHAALKEQIHGLKELNYKINKEAENLTNALKGDVKQQGLWGEIRLEGILNSAGLVKNTHYYKEKQLHSESGTLQRPDYIVNLPDNKCLIIDSKVSLVAYSNYFGTDNEVDKATYLEKHVLSVQTHIRTLGEKNYGQLHQINQPDYILMFLANEGALIAALEERPQLYEMALERNIVIVTATTLMATLKTVSYLWKHELQSKNAQEIARQAGNLYDKLVSFTKDLTKIGTSISQAQGAYEDAFSKLQAGRGNLISRAEKLKSLGARTSKQFPEGLTDTSEGELPESPE